MRGAAAVVEHGHDGCAAGLVHRHVERGRAGADAGEGGREGGGGGDEGSEGDGAHVDGLWESSDAREVI